MNRYSSDFYAFEERDARKSAAAIVPMLINLLRPASVADVGCGTGAWLATFLARGVNDVLGIDGPWLNPDQRSVSAEQFMARDLAQPFRLDRKFDLVLCLEVAEHIPAASNGVLFDSLTALGDTVLFSAAVPGQGGLHHVNEQWPEYWAELFCDRGFEVLDIIRPQVWSDPRVVAYYAQNIFLAVRNTRNDVLEQCNRLSIPTSGGGSIQNMIHPAVWADRLSRPAEELFSASELGRAFLRRARAASAIRLHGALRRFGRRSGNP